MPPPFGTHVLEREKLALWFKHSCALLNFPPTCRSPIIRSALKILHVGEDISSRGFFFFFQAFLVEDFLHFFFFFGGLGWRIILLGVL